MPRRLGCEANTPSLRGAVVIQAGGRRFQMRVAARAGCWPPLWRLWRAAAAPGLRSGRYAAGPWRPCALGAWRRQCAWVQHDDRGRGPGRPGAGEPIGWHGREGTDEDAVRTRPGPRLAARAGAGVARAATAQRAGHGG